TGLTPSQGWYKALEMCAHLHSWFMLQGNMGGAVKRTSEPVAYFEGIVSEPAPIKKGTKLTLDAHGSYAFSNAKRLKLIPASRLRFKWNFGDGSKGKGVKVTHVFKGSSTVTLTVSVGRAKDVMRQNIVIE
ncbi:MAG TPA: PKD domain-containing protein, partial [Actinomycetota bacterium]|nr:PKD domain-containing protein [Actinomycetota bacterium]